MSQSRIYLSINYSEIKCSKARPVPHLKTSAVKKIPMQLLARKNYLANKPQEKEQVAEFQ